MRRVWAGERVHVDLGGPDRPAPVQPGGPELLSAPSDARTIRARLRWADGLVGMSLDVDLAGDGAASSTSPPAVGRRWPTARPATDDVVPVALDDGPARPDAGGPAPAPLHELDPRQYVDVLAGTSRPRRHRGTTC